MRSYALVIAMTATAVACKWVATQKESYRRQHRLLEELETRSSEWSNCSVGTEPAEPKWLGYFVPRETFRRVSFLQFVGDIRAEDVKCVASLSSVEELQFFMSPVTDADLAPFKHSQMRVRILRTRRHSRHRQGGGVLCRHSRNNDRRSGVLQQSGSSGDTGSSAEVLGTPYIRTSGVPRTSKAMPWRRYSMRALGLPGMKPRARSA